MRVTTTNRTSKLQTATRTKTSSTTILNEQTGHLQNGTTIVSPTSLNNGTLRLIDSGDYLSTAVSPQQQQPVTTSTMLQYLQPSSNAIQNMLIQQILTSPEQQRLLVEKINQQLSEQIQLNLVQPTTTTANTTSNSDVIKQIQNQLANQQLLLQQVSSKQQQQQQIPSLFSITNSNNSNQPTTATVQYLTTTPPNSSTSGLNLIGTTPTETRIIMPTATTTTINRSTQQDSSSNPLYQRNYCCWPSCDTLCSSLMDFNRHLTDEHSLDDRSVAQARVQQHVVQQLEALLTREREILQSMMKHLHGGNPQHNSNGASSSNPATTATAHIITHQPARTLTSYHNNRSAQLSSPTSSTTTLHHLPIVKLENAFLTSTGLVKTTGTSQDLSSVNNASNCCTTCCCTRA
jgi:hypothetical protein